ncbi:MAG: hypothetical protein QXJ75_01765 [Candidatus Bathyarchaeia archaeon]
MSRLNLVKRLHEIGAIKFGEFKLKSGKISPYYVDLRILPSYPSVLREVGRVMGEMIYSLPEKPTRLCGIPAAGLAIATMVGVETGVPTVYVRKEPMVYRDLLMKLRTFIKERKYQPDEIPGVEKAIEIIEELSGLKTHGIARYVDGELQNGDRIGIVDDLITTAESKLEARDLIKLEAERRNLNVRIIGVYVLIDREQGGREALQKEGLKLYSVATIRDVAKWLKDLGNISPQMYSTIVNYTTSERKAACLE